jgi:5-methylthioadenosine/S-adenosylhomocysteine deaminase
MTSNQAPLVFRGGTVVTMVDAHSVLSGADVLVVDGAFAAIGEALEGP